MIVFGSARLGRRRSLLALVFACLLVSCALAFGASPAMAVVSSYTCTGVVATDTANLQPLIDAGGTVLIWGPLPCVGNFTVSVSDVILVGTGFHVHNTKPPVRLDGNGTGSVLTVSAGHSLTVYGLTITNGNGSGGPDGDDGGGISVDGSTGTGRPSGSPVPAPPAPVATVTLDDSWVIGNTSSDEGGGIVAFNGAIVNVNDTSTVINNSSGFDGGGIAADSGATVNLNTARVVGNTTVFYGGGVNLDLSTLTATNSMIKANQTTDIELAAGGGIGSIGSIVSLTGTAVTANHSLNGGGIESDGSAGTNNVFLHAGTKVSGNSATVDGGGVWLTNGGLLTIDPGASVTANSPDNVS
jgi:hypothetical protein